MATIIRTNTVIANNNAEYLVPSLPLEPAGRYVASTVENVSTIPDAVGYIGTASTRGTSTATLLTEGQRRLKIFGGYDTGLYVINSYKPTGAFTVAFVIDASAPGAQILDMGNYRVGLNDNGFYVNRQSVSISIPADLTRPNVLIVSFDGNNSAAWLNGTKTALALGDNKDGLMTTHFGRAGGTNAIGTTYYEFSIWRRAILDSEAAALSAAYKKIYPALG